MRLKPTVAAAMTATFVIGGGALAAPAQAAEPAARIDAARTCPAAARTENGTCAVRVATRATSSRQSTAKARLAKAAQRADRTRSNARTVSAAAMPAAFQMPEVAKMTIYKEGQGNHKKSYTCGPSATRNMVSAMNKHYTGKYKDYGEHAFEVWEKTTRAGTSAANVAATLNNHFWGFGHWKTYRPTSVAAYLAQVQTDTYRYHQPVIKNLDTEYLGYYHGKALNHFNFDYGYSISRTGTSYVWMADEWDPVYTYGHSSYGNPYGRHKVAAINAYRSVIHTSYHFMIV